MLSDTWMLLIMVFIVFALCVFFGYLWWEFTNKSKFWLIILVLVISFLGWTSLHYHNCRIPSIIKCQAAHVSGLEYNYCTGDTYTPGINSNLDKFCLYELNNNCLLIPNGCVDAKDEYIDGYCLSYVPFTCILFNSP